MNNRDQLAKIFELFINPKPTEQGTQYIDDQFTEHKARILAMLQEWPLESSREQIQTYFSDPDFRVYIYDIATTSGNLRARDALNYFMDMPSSDETDEIKEEKKPITLPATVTTPKVINDRMLKLTAFHSICLDVELTQSGILKFDQCDLGDPKVGIAFESILVAAAHNPNIHTWLFNDCQFFHDNGLLEICPAAPNLEKLIKAVNNNIHLRHLDCRDKKGQERSYGRQHYSDEEAFLRKIPCRITNPRLISIHTSINLKHVMYSPSLLCQKLVIEDEMPIYNLNTIFESKESIPTHTRVLCINSSNLYLMVPQWCNPFYNPLQQQSDVGNFLLRHQELRALKLNASSSCFLNQMFNIWPDNSCRFTPEFSFFDWMRPIVTRANQLELVSISYSDCEHYRASNYQLQLEVTLAVFNAELDTLYKETMKNIIKCLDSTRLLTPIGINFIIADYCLKRPVRFVCNISDSDLDRYLTLCTPITKVPRLIEPPVMTALSISDINKEFKQISFAPNTSSIEIFLIEIHRLIKKMGVACTQQGTKMVLVELEKQIASQKMERNLDNLLSDLTKANLSLQSFEKPKGKGLFSPSHPDQKLIDIVNLMIKSIESRLANAEERLLWNTPAKLDR